MIHPSSAPEPPDPRQLIEQLKSVVERVDSPSPPPPESSVILDKLLDELASTWVNIRGKEETPKTTIIKSLYFWVKYLMQMFIFWDKFQHRVHHKIDSIRHSKIKGINKFICLILDDLFEINRDDIFSTSITAQKIDQFMETINVDNENKQKEILDSVVQKLNDLISKHSDKIVPPVMVTLDDIEVLKACLRDIIESIKTYQDYLEYTLKTDQKRLRRLRSL